jgi:hypothetical protein
MVLEVSAYAYFASVYLKAFPSSFTFDYHQNGMRAVEILV